jgi:hypothetical protein
VAPITVPHTKKKKQIHQYLDLDEYWHITLCGVRSVIVSLAIVIRLLAKDCLRKMAGAEVFIAGVLILFIHQSDVSGSYFVATDYAARTHEQLLNVEFLHTGHTSTSP